MKPKIPAVIIGSSIGLVVLGAVILVASRAHGPQALAATPKRVSVIAPEQTTYRPSRRYVGAVYPWLSANIGPQFVAAMVDDVLVRPGDQVQRGALLARLACQHVAANAQALSASAKATEAREHALAEESKRLSEMAKLGFVSENERQKKMAESTAETAQLASAQAKTLSGSLEQNDCMLRAPFAGEIGERFVDPGAFVRPGMALLTLIDRNKVRIATDVPENDYQVVAPGAEVRIRLLATGQELKGTVARRSPSAVAATRTIHCEIDMPNDDRALPTGTTAELFLEVDTPEPALAVPLSAASVRGKKVSLFVVDANVAHLKTVRLLGEREGKLFVEASLPQDARVVSEGRAGLNDGDHVHSGADPFVTVMDKPMEKQAAP